VKRRHAWHDSTFGRAMLFLGSLRFAIPIMVLVAVALGLATSLDSAYGARAAAHWVYASGWFIALMALVCLTLICSVVTRYPWRRRHVGFITVHAGLIVLIVGGFVSLFGRIEGQLRLAEGMSADHFEVNTFRLELHDANGELLDSVPDDEHLHGHVRLGGLDLDIVGHWANTAEERFVADDGPEPLRAFEVATDPDATKGVWIAESGKTGGPTSLDGMSVRVLAAGEDWSPPPDATGYVFVHGDERLPLPGEGVEVFEGWSVSGVRRFRSAQVDADGKLSENEGGEPNPAIEVLITNGAGSVERHIVFDRFPNMVLGRLLDGDTVSGAQLHAAGPGVESLVLFGDPPAVSAAYTGADGSVERFGCDGTLPWTFHPTGHSFTVLNQVTRARPTTRLVEAPPAAARRPAVLVSIDGADPVPILWKAPTPVPGADTTLLFGPRRVALPFTIRLDDFRKTDYPGTTTAMSYESAVTVAAPDGRATQHTISMNSPLADAGWKLYQSGFQGDSITVFSVMRDPGLPVVYTGCVILCVGIGVTFYSRSLSIGHPGIGRDPADEEAAP